MATWVSPLNSLPANGATVWIRLYEYFNDPCLAVYTSSTQTFVSSDSGLIVPAYMVARWKSQ